MTAFHDKVFFSYATVAPTCDASYTTVKAFLDEFHQIGPPEVLYKYDPYESKVAEEAAHLLNCDPDEITCIKNTTEGINIASEALPLKAGDEVLVQDCEYPANLLPWLKKCKDGLAITVVKGTGSEESYHNLLAAIGSKTKAIAVSSAQYYDGYMADLMTLAKTCHERGIFLVVDAVQTVGVRRLDLQKVQADFLICGGQKYLQAGMGSGFLYVNRHVMSKLKDTKVGIRSMQSFDSTGYTLKTTAGRFQDGTQNEAGIVALHAALHRINEIGIDEIERQNLTLLDSIKDCLKKHDIPFIDNGNHQSNIVSMPVGDPRMLFEYLKERSIYIKPIKDVARLSFVHTSTMADVETLAQNVRAWLDQAS